MEAFDAFWADAVRLLRLGVEERAILTVDGATRAGTRYGERTNIFKKKTCPRCGEAIRQLAMAGRKAFCCDGCQERR